MSTHNSSLLRFEVHNEDRMDERKFHRLFDGNEPRHEKTNVLVSDQVRHKPGCTATRDKRLEISDVESRGIVLSCSENKGAGQLRGYREADLRLCFRNRKKSVFP